MIIIDRLAMKQDIEDEFEKWNRRRDDLKTWILNSMETRLMKMNEKKHSTEIMKEAKKILTWGMKSNDFSNEDEWETALEKIKKWEKMIKDQPNEEDIEKLKNTKMILIKTKRALLKEIERNHPFINTETIPFDESSPYFVAREINGTAKILWMLDKNEMKAKIILQKKKQSKTTIEDMEKIRFRYKMTRIVTNPLNDGKYSFKGHVEDIIRNYDIEETVTVKKEKLHSVNDEPSKHSKTKYKNGHLEEERYWHENGVLNRRNGPAIVTGERTEWWIDGKRHRENGPAVERTITDESQNIHSPSGEEWYKNGIRHRSDGPAVTFEYRNGKKTEWYENGSLHREDGPAVIEENRDRTYGYTKKEWWKKGEVEKIEIDEYEPQ